MAKNMIDTCENTDWLKLTATDAHKTQVQRALASYYLDHKIEAKMNI